MLDQMTLRDRIRRAALLILDADEKPKADKALETSGAAPAARDTSKPLCATCKHFDLKSGQAALSANPAMLAASQTIPPWAMGRKVERDKNGALVPPEGTSPEWLEATWADLGACKQKGEGVFLFHSCGSYEAKGN